MVWMASVAVALVVEGRVEKFAPIPMIATGGGTIKGAYLVAISAIVLRRIRAVF